MPLKQQYGRPPVPLRRALLRTPTTIMEEVRANSKSDAAFVKKMMEKNFRDHPGRFEKPESDAMRERLEESGVYLSIPPPKTPRGKKPMPLPGTLKKRKPPKRIVRAGKRRKTRRKRKRKRTRRKRKRKRKKSRKRRR
tara:strand:+ start:390 stop:803 length:414 start_codon:yes stop_codon:yes gene_type:complete